MNLIFRIILLLLFTGNLFGQSVEDYDWRNVPIGGGGYITGMKIHPLDATKRYFRTDVGGAYRWNESTGRMDQIIYLPNSNFYSVAGIALHPTNTNIVYLAVGRNCDPNQTAILKSTNAGVDFVPLNIPNIPFWFAANGGRGCDSSNDTNGANNGDKDRQGTPLEVNPYNPNELYIGTRGKGLYILNVNSLALTKVNAIPDNPDQYSVRSVVFHPTMQRVYVAYAGHGVYVGYGNQNYIQYGGTNNTELKDAIDLSISKNANYMLVACRTQGILKANNLTGALTWTNLTGLNPAIGEGYLTADCSPHNDQVAITVPAAWNQINKFQVTTDGGNTWNQIGGSVALSDNIFRWRHEAFANHVSQIAFDPSNSSKMYYTSWFSTFSTSNFKTSGHTNWNSFEAGGHEEIVPTELVAFPANSEGNFLMAGSGDHTGFIFNDNHITDPNAFATFHLAERSINNVAPLKKSASMDFCEKQPDNLIVCITKEWHESDGGILKSTNGGKDWELLAGFNPSSNFKSLLAMSSDDPNNFIALSNKGMQYTENGGVSFGFATGANQLSADCTIPYNISCKGATNFSGTNVNSNVFGSFRNITADRNFDCVFYYYDWDGDFSISTDGGKNWCVVNNNTLPASTNIWEKSRIISIPGHPGHLWMNINKKLWHSQDAGETWTNYSATTTVNDVTALSFGKGFNSNYEALYIYGKLDGQSLNYFYRSDDRGLTWIRINDHTEKEVWGDNKIIAGDRNVAGRLYSVASGQGVLVGEGDCASESNLVVTCDPEDSIGECSGEDNLTAATLWNNTNIALLEGCSSAAFSTSVTVTSNFDFANFEGTCGSKGTITVMYTITDDCNNSENKQATYSRDDITPPIVTCLVDDYETDCATCDNESLATVWNDANIAKLLACSSDMCLPTDEIIVISDFDFTNFEVSCDAAWIVVTYVILDACGNSAIQQASYGSGDATKPIVTCEPDDNTGECNTADNITIITAWNDANIAKLKACSSDEGSTNVIVSSDFDFANFIPNCGSSGSITVTYTIQDDCINTVEKQATYTLEDSTPPTVVAKDITIQLDEITGIAEITPALILESMEDECSEVTIQGISQSTNFACGDNIVELSVVDECGNVGVATATVTVNCFVSIGGTLFVDKNNNSTQDSDEVGIAAIQVQLYDTLGNLIDEMFTDSNGNYFFSHQAPGTYVVAIPTPDPLINISSTGNGSDNQVDGDDNGVQIIEGGATASLPIILNPGTEPTVEQAQGGTQDDAHDENGDMTIDFGFYARASVGNHVWFDVDGNGIQDDGEPGLNGVSINLIDANDNIVSATTSDADGNFKFDNLAPGNYILQFIAPNAFTAVVQDANGIEGETSNGIGLNEDALDNDADPNTGLTHVVTLESGEDEDEIDAGFNLILDVELQSFTGRYVEERSLTALEWVTSNEVNSDYFIIKRAYENGEFESIGRVEAAGVSTNETVYTLEDREVSNGGTYLYRLVQVDADGSETVSDIISVFVRSFEKMDPQVSFYPNPTSDYINVDVFKNVDDLVQLEMFDLRGKVVLINNIDVNANSNTAQLKVPIRDLPSATYILRIKVGNQVFAKKVAIVD